MHWKNRKVLITGGASFIGSHLAEALLNSGASVRVADDLSSGKLENLSAIKSDIQFMEGDLRYIDFSSRASEGCDNVFHLAAEHGGRGYISTHPANCAGNMALDNIVFSTAAKIMYLISHLQVLLAYTLQIFRKRNSYLKKPWLILQNEAEHLPMKNMGGQN